MQVRSDAEGRIESWRAAMSWREEIWRGMFFEMAYKYERIGDRN